MYVCVYLCLCLVVSGNVTERTVYLRRNKRQTILSLTVHNQTSNSDRYVDRRRVKLSLFLNNLNYQKLYNFPTSHDNNILSCRVTFKVFYIQIRSD